MASWYDDVTEGVTDFIHGITDIVGITDSKAPERAQEAAQEGMDSANAQLDQDLQPGLGALDTAQYGRSLGQNLDVYGQQMQGAMDQTQQAGDLSLGEMDAGDAGNVRDYLNPMMDEVLAKTNQAVQGNAGSALQSSATARNTADAVSGKAADFWNTAYDQAMKNSQNNQHSISNFGKSAAQTGTLAQQNLDAQNQPALDWINLNNDRAMTRYGGNIGLTQSATEAAGQSRAII